MTDKPPAPSLATGAPLTHETWADFVARMRHHHRGEGVREHCTANAIFIVEARRFTYGVDLDYDPERVVVCDGSEWASPQAYWDGADEHGRSRLDESAAARHDAGYLSADKFLSADQNDQWNILNDLPDHHVVGRVERWDYIGAHLTREAADAFIRRKSHDYPEGLRVNVESRQYAWEFAAVVDAIIDGRLVLALPCEHDADKLTEGRRLPLRYGSAATQVCRCGSWRVVDHRPARWRVDSLDAAIAAADSGGQEL